MPSFYYTNPIIGQSVQNLTQAIFGDPERDVRMGLLGDQRRVSQAQRRKLEAEALQQEILNREQQMAAEALEDTVAQLVGGLGLADPRAASGTSAGLRHVLRAGAGSNASQLASAITELLSSGLAYGGDEDQMRRSLVAQGRQPTERFAGSEARADALIDTRATDELAKVLLGESLRADAAMDRTRLMEEGRDRRHSITEAGRARRAAERAATERAPIRVGPSDYEAILEAIEQRTLDAVGDAPVSPRRVALDPAAESALVQTIAQLFQDTRNLPIATQQGWEQVMGEPDVEVVGNWNPFVRNRATVRPGASVQPGDVYSEARAAIAAGADPEAVRRRLRERGYDPSRL